MYFRVWIVVFWVMTPCILADNYQPFGGMYCLFLQGRSDSYFYPEMEAFLFSKILH
jgi:hypothetical protein